eukprot:1289154-Prymnesium_polylepis.2
MHAVRAAPSVGKGGNCAPPPHALSTTFSTREATNAPANATSGSRSALATADCCNWAARGAEDSAVINKHFEVLHERRALGLSTTLELYCGGTVTLGVGNARALGRPRALGSPRALGGTSLSFPVVAYTPSGATPQRRAPSATACSQIAVVWARCDLVIGYVRIPRCVAKLKLVLGRVCDDSTARASPRVGIKLKQRHVCLCARKRRETRLERVKAIGRREGLLAAPVGYTLASFESKASSTGVV